MKCINLHKKTCEYTVFFFNNLLKQIKDPPLHGLHWGLQGNLCSGAWSSSCSSSSTDRCGCRVAPLTCSHSSLPAALPAVFGHGGDFWHLLREATAEPPATRTWPHKPNRRVEEQPFGILQVPLPWIIFNRNVKMCEHYLGMLKNDRRM